MVGPTTRNTGLPVHSSHTTQTQALVPHTSAAGASSGITQRILSSLPGANAARWVGRNAKAAALNLWKNKGYMGHEAARRGTGGAFNMITSASAQFLVLQKSQNPYYMMLAGGLTGALTKSYCAEAIGKLGKNCNLPDSTAAKLIEFADHVLDATQHMGGALALQNLAKKSLLASINVSPESPEASAELLKLLAGTFLALVAMEGTKEGLDFGRRMLIAGAKASRSDATIESKPKRKFLEPLNVVSDSAKKMHFDFGLRLVENLGIAPGNLAAVGRWGKGALKVAQVGPFNALGVTIAKLGHGYGRNWLYNKFAAPKKPASSEQVDPMAIDLEARRPETDTAVATHESPDLPPPRDFEEAAAKTSEQKNKSVEHQPLSTTAAGSSSAPLDKAVDKDKKELSEAEGSNTSAPETHIAAQRTRPQATFASIDDLMMRNAAETVSPAPLDTNPAPLSSTIAHQAMPIDNDEEDEEEFFDAPEFPQGPPNTGASSASGKANFSLSKEDIADIFTKLEALGKSSAVTPENDNSKAKAE